MGKKKCASTSGGVYRQLLGGRQAMESGLPYDTKVEYLRTNSNNQWFSTGYVINGRSRFVFDASVIGNTGYSRAVFGARNSSSPYAISYMWFGSVGSQIVVYWDGSKQKYFQSKNASGKTDIVGGAKYSFDIDYASRTVKRNGLLMSQYFDGSSVVEQTQFDAPRIPTLPIYIFARNTDGNAYPGGDGKVSIYKFQIYEGESLVHNYIPVRVAMEGCLYDSVTCELLTNRGTDSFTVGPDL